MSKEFSAFQASSKYYDLIYSDKNYKAECDFLEEIFRRYSESEPKSILDVGCGTGGHALPLAKRGYSVTGIDFSSSMIEAAKRKANRTGLDVQFHLADIRDFQLRKRFDAGIAMFAVVNYLLENKDIISALTCISKHLKKKSLFVFDFWYGPAVISVRPSVRVKVLKHNNLKLLRVAKPSLDSYRHICAVDYHFLITQGNRLVDEFDEKHTVRFLFPQEIRHYLEECGFNLVMMFPFMEIDGKLDESCWNATAVTKLE